MTDTSDNSPTSTGMPGGSKATAVIKLLTRARGASITEIQDATGWLPHSVRAHLSGLRKRGRILTKEQRRSGETAYRFAKPAPIASETDAA